MKKRILSSILALCMVMSMAFALPITVGAKSEGDYTYMVENGEAGITACDTAISGNVTIPDTLGGYPVTAILNQAFKSCSQMTGVTIPDSVTYIAYAAFFDCTALADISIGNNVTDIGINVFENTAYYNEASNWTDDVLYIGNYLIEAKWDITGNLEIPGNIKVISTNAFYNRTDLTGVIIPDSVTTIGYGAFDECTSLYDITIGNNVTVIDEDAFSSTAYYNDASNWTDDALYIGKYFLKAKKEISGSYTIPETIEIVANGAFDDCNSLISVTIPGSVTAIGEWMFDNCSSLESVTIEDGITTINNGAFNNCDALTNVTIPASVTYIDSYAFDYCTNLNNIVIDENNPSYCVSDGHIFSKDMTKLVRYNISSSATEFTIPNTVTTIGMGAFSAAELTTITIPASVRKVEEEGFISSHITFIDIPLTVQEIGAYAFQWCGNLTSINVAAENPNYSSDNGVLFNKNKTEIITYPEGKTENSYSIPSSVTTIAESCFAYNKYLQIILLPTTLSSVEQWAFDECMLEKVLYYGTAQQWQEINIESDNEALTEANITYEYDGALAKIKDVSCAYDSDNGKLSANVTFDYLFDAGDLLLAIYDDSGRFVDVKKETLTLSDANGSFEFDADDSSLDYTAKAFYWDGINTIIPLTDSIEVGIKQAYVIDTVLESEHPYAEDTEEIKTYTYDGDCTKIDVTFSLETETEEEYDYICIYDADGNEIGVYTGTELAGKTVSVPGNTVKVQLFSDGSETYYGFKTERIVVYK